MIKLHESACKKAGKEFMEELMKEPVLINSFFKEKCSCDADRSASNATVRKTS